MKISFIKLTTSPQHFKFEKDGLVFGGEIKKIGQNLAECKAKITGRIPHICDRCGKDITLNLNENVCLNLSDGIYKDLENELSDTIEFFDGEIDLDEILTSEVEAYKSDYFYCDDCKTLKGE